MEKPCVGAPYMCVGWGVAELVTEILARLSSQGVGSTAASSTGYLLRARGFVESTGPNPRQIVVIPTGGLNIETTDDDLHRPTFQVQVRGSPDDSTGVEATVTAVAQALNWADSTNFAGLGRRYVEIQQQGDMIWLGPDANREPVYAQNFMAWRSRTT